MQPTEPTQAEIDRVVSLLRVRKREQGKSGPHVVADCVAPGCPSPKEHMTVNLDSGKWFCHRCDEGGHLWTLATHMGVRLRERQLVRSAASVLVGKQNDPPKRMRNAKGFTPQSLAESSARVLNPQDEKGAKVHSYLAGRGFTDDTIERFQLCVAHIQHKDKRELAVGIPYMEQGKVPLLKMRNLETDKDKRAFARTKGSDSLLFNADAVRDCKQVVMVEGELDAVSLWQLGVTNVAASSTGAKKNIPESWVEVLGGADDVVLWYDDDEAGEEAQVALMTRLGSHRCRIARIPDELADEVEASTGKRPKDPNDLLRAGIEPERVKAVVTDALGTVNAAVVQPGTFADALAKEIDKGEASLGVPSKWAAVNALIRGWRLGEVTLLTGHTGHGKSTNLLEICEMLAEAGEPTLASAFENGPKGLVRKMAQRRLGRPLSSVKSDLDREQAHEALRKLNNTPMYVIDMYGRQRMSVIADAIRYAVNRMGVRYVALDHLHFFLTKDHDRQDEREAIDNAVRDIVTLSRELNIHIFLVAHPRGSVELNTVPTGESLRGSASIKQEVDNGITVYRAVDLDGSAVNKELRLKDPSGRHIKVKLGPSSVLFLVWKARHDDAREGCCVLEFKSRSLEYEDQSTEPEHAPDPRVPDNDENQPRDPFVDLLN